MSKGGVNGTACCAWLPAHTGSMNQLYMLESRWVHQTCRFEVTEGDL